MMHAKRPKKGLRVRTGIKAGLGATQQAYPAPRRMPLAEQYGSTQIDTTQNTFNTGDSVI